MLNGADGLGSRVGDGKRNLGKMMMDATSLSSAKDVRRDRIARMLSPRSLAIIGMSAREGTAGHMVLRNFLANEFAGPIHLVGRTAGEIEGLPIVTDIAALPEGIDTAVLALPANGVAEALSACAAKKVGAAVVFASGFAELGEEARAEQARIGEQVRESGPAVVGPNCIGYSNYIDGFTVGFTNVAKIPRVAPDRRDAVAIVAQSGGLAGHLRLGLIARGVPVSYNISTGNEMDLCIADFVDHLLDDAATQVVLVYAETIRQPQAFLAAARRARQMGKPILMLQPGRSAQAQAATQSHTGAMAGDYAVMRAYVEREGVVLVETMDELLDTCELLARYPKPSAGGLGVVTFSGAYCAIAHDFCEDIGVALPPLSDATAEALKPQMPPNIEPHNPLDLGTQPIWQPELLGVGVKALLNDPAMGGVAISIAAGAPAKSMAWLEQVVEAGRGRDKPLALTFLGDTSPLAEPILQTARDNGIVLMRSSDRMLRAMGHMIARADTERLSDTSDEPFLDLPDLPDGALPEWRGKAYLAAAGISTPKGGLVQSVDEAIKLADRIGYPVVLKAQAGALAHKTEAGGVILNLRDAQAVRAAWETVLANVQRAQPGLVLDGVLVEAMVGKGVELVIGAKRDPEWGPVLLIGLGGVFVELFHDVCLLPADASKAEIVEAFGGLKAAKLLQGFRNAPPADLDAAAEIAHRIGQLMLQQPAISEIDVNPLMVHPRGQGATALDALIVTA